MFIQNYAIGLGNGQARVPPGEDHPQLDRQLVQHDAKVISRIFYHARKTARRVKNLVVPEYHGANLPTPQLREVIKPIEISNAFQALADEALEMVNDDHIDIVLADERPEVRKIFKDIPKRILNAAIEDANIEDKLQDIKPPDYFADGDKVLNKKKEASRHQAARLLEDHIPIDNRYAMQNDHIMVEPAKRKKENYRRIVQQVIKKDLYYYLKIKYFMKERTPAMIQQLVSDCRVYLNKKGSNMDTQEDYDLVSAAVLAVWLPCKEELRFRAAMKNPVVLDGINAINNVCRGNLGRAGKLVDPTPKVSRFSKLTTNEVLITPKQ